MKYKTHGPHRPLRQHLLMLFSDTDTGPPWRWEIGNDRGTSKDLLLHLSNENIGKKKSRKINTFKTVEISQRFAIFRGTFIQQQQMLKFGNNRILWNFNLP